MANLKEIRNRIGSVKNTRKITSAMSRIAAARLQRAQRALVAVRPYGDRVLAVTRRLIDDVHASGIQLDHPLLARRPAQRVLVVAVTADRGLCGGFNANVSRDAAALVRHLRKEGREVVLASVGRKGVAYFKSQRWSVDRQFAAPESKNVVEIGTEVADFILDAFTREEVAAAGEDGAAAAGGLARVDRVVLVYNHFKSVLSQEVTRVQLLPFRGQSAGAHGQAFDGDATPDVTDDHGPAPAVRLEHREESSQDSAASGIVEPDAATVVSELLPMALRATVQQALSNSVVAEIAARRNAMDSATDNATQLIADLTLVYNRERQAAITKELMEIIGGAEALKG